MSTTTKIIKVAIIDDDEGFLFSLKEYLSFFPEIDLLGFASNYKQAKKILENNQIDLVFLDIEMPIRNGFELLQESKLAGNNNFKVVFYTAYDKYIIQALHESALDYLLKPIKLEELKKVIERFKLQKAITPQTIVPYGFNCISEIISLPTSTGIRFLDKNSILLFECTSESIFGKKRWKAILSDRTQIMLRTTISANDILDFVGKSKFIRINPACIVNVNFLSAIEYSTRACQLIPPFNDITIIASKSNMAEIRKNFDLL